MGSAANAGAPGGARYDLEILDFAARPSRFRVPGEGRRPGARTRFRCRLRPPRLSRRSRPSSIARTTPGFRR